MKEKEEIRKKALAARDAIPAQERKLRSARACQVLAWHFAEHFANNASLACEAPAACGTPATCEALATCGAPTAFGAPSCNAPATREAPAAFGAPSFGVPTACGTLPTCGALTAFGAPSTCNTNPACSAPTACNSPLVALYSAMKSEVDLTELATASFTRGWQVCFPCMVKESPLPQAAASESSAKAPTRMEFFLVAHDQMKCARKAFLSHPLRSFAREELERQGFRRIAPREIDAVVVPMVAFDARNNRLGYGGGNYDRFLPQLREDAVVAGVAFEEQRTPAVPTEPHDLPLPFIVKA